MLSIMSKGNAISVIMAIMSAQLQQCDQLADWISAAEVERLFSSSPLPVSFDKSMDYVIFIRIQPTQCGDQFISTFFPEVF